MVVAIRIAPERGSAAWGPSGRPVLTFTATPSYHEFAEGYFLRRDAMR
ncbi:hypothetical protein ACIQMJ_27320 [Actinosynnema sp. NPDC091369]